MPEMSTRRLPQLVPALLPVLPVLATLSLYLPSGLLSPFRIVLALAMLATGWLLWQARGAGAALSSVLPVRPVGWWLLANTACFVSFGALGMMRYAGRTQPAELFYVSIILACCFVAMQVHTLRHLHWLLRGWLVAGLLAAVPAAYEVLTAKHLPRYPGGQYWPPIRQGWNIIASFFNNPNLYAYLLGVILLLSPLGLALERSRGWRLAWVVVAVSGGYFLLRTEGRIALLAVAAGMVLWAWRERLTRWLTLAGVVLTGVLIVIGVAPVRDLALQILRAFTDVSHPGRSGWIRLQLLRSGWRMLKDSDYLGAGPGSYEVWTGSPDNPYRWHDYINPHNATIEVASQYGVVTAGVIAATLVAAAVLGLRTSNAAARAGEHRWGPARTVGIGLAIQAAVLPALSASHSSWLDQPLSALHMMTIVAMSMVCLRMGHNRTIGSAGPVAGEEEPRPEHHGNSAGDDSDSHRS